MRRFSVLFETLDATTSTNAKVAALTAYFHDAPAADAAWAVYFLAGQRLKRLIGAARLRQWLAQACGLPAWLVEDSYANVGDLAETVALLMSDEDRQPSDIALHVWVEQRLLPLAAADEPVQRAAVTAWWRELDRWQCFLVTKLLTGALRIGVAKTLLMRALGQVAGVDAAVIAHRLSGDWQPSASAYAALLSGEADADQTARPYPFLLASPLDRPVVDLGPREDWLAEWKWDGIRAQIIRRGDQSLLWSRGEERLDEAFPDLLATAATLPACVLDGEIVAWDGGIQPFSTLQRRLNRKRPSAKLIGEVAIRFLAYDLIELDGNDLRGSPLIERRDRLDRLLATAPPNITTSPLVPDTDWAALATRREQARARGVEGLMLKHKQSAYGVGRRKGDWWKWKIDPRTVDAVLVYAQAGHGRRANLYTDYTFAVHDDDQLVPVAKAYSGLSDAEIAELDRWIRRHTVDRFGPVRQVEPVHVFELAFEGIQVSKRHKAGVALRFPRILRWRTDKLPRDADTLASLRALLNVNDSG